MNSARFPHGSKQVSRREAVQWVMAAVAASALPSTSRSAPRRATSRPAGPAKPYGGDPDLLKVYEPGELWPLTFTDAQRETATILADVIIPKDRLGPAASEVGVPAMIDEWISAPYPEQQADRPIVIEGLAWLDTEAGTRFHKAFAQLDTAQHHAICDDICFTETAKPSFHKPAEFFSRFRSLCAGAYYATPAGWQAIGYVGNVPLEKFDGPPPEVLQKLGVTQTVR